MYNLQIHVEEPTQTIVNNLIVKDWREARFIQIRSANGDPISNEEKDQIAGGFVELAKQNGLSVPIIMFGDHLEIKVFALEEAPKEVEGQLLLDV